MKQSISLILAATLSLTSLQSASALDVTGNGNHYVRVTRENDQVKFEECFKGSNPECIRTLGPKTWYSVKELKSQRATETWQAYGSILADVGIVVVAVYGGAVAGASLAAAGAGTGTAGGVIGGVFASIGGGVLGGGAGAVGGTVLVSTVQALNPNEQFRQAGAVSDDVINDRPVEKANMTKYIQRLTLVLEKL